VSPDYQTNRGWSDLMIPQIRRIIGPFLLGPAPYEKDCKEATDLIVLHGGGVDIAARVRRPGFLDRYPNDITFRSKLDNGYATELEKVIRGFARWFFYGHTNEALEIIRWFLVDLNAFRAHLIMNAGALRCGEISNGDGTHFTYYDLTSFPSDPPILVATDRMLRAA
jgi:hypothetical protein